VQSATERLALRLFTATLYILQPIARLWDECSTGFLHGESAPPVSARRA